MASIKVVLRKKKNKDGSYPLAIRITNDRKSSFIHIGQSIQEKHWDAVNGKVRKSHPNSERLNKLIIKKTSQANDKLIDLELQEKDVSSKEVRNQIKQGSSKVTFLAQSEVYLDNLKESGKRNRFKSEEPRVNRFKEFLKGEDISFQEITVPLLNRFRAYLKGTRNISERTIINHLMVIRTIYNQAIKGGIVDQRYYPFGKDKVPIKFPDSLKIGLTEKEVKRIEELDLESNPQVNHARNVWLISFYFAGMRVSDVLRLKLSDFQDDRLHYAMGKNLKGGSLKVPKKALAILKYYKHDEPKNDLVFPELKVLEKLDDRYIMEMKIANAVKQLNKYLREVATSAKIKKPLTMHIARHTFGNISGDRISIQMLQKLYRHSSIKTTISYQSNFIHKDTDEALDAVLNY
ncbi:MAG: site-specific integrase [Bacteroidetes bacterium]|nr:site-specific integrase [Bacteroidota bacterium]